MTGRVVWLDKGDLIMDGDPKEVTKKYMEFTKLLAKGNNNSAFALLADLRASLEMSNIVSATGSGRRAAVKR